MIESEICHHSRAILQLGENFRSRYKNELPSDINSFDGTNNACLFYPHRKPAIMRSDPDPSGMCLVGYQNNGKVSLLYTTSSKNKIPLCSKCRGDDCLCYKAFREGCKKGLFSRTVLLGGSVQRSEEFHSGTGRDRIQVHSRDPGIFWDGISLIFSSQDFLEIVRDFRD